MLSYRHGYHAGNHGDVLKHWVLILCLEYLKKKDKPFFYIDTHSGAGAYSLADAYARKTGEADDGIGRLWDQPNLPATLQGLLNLVRGMNQGNQATLKHYPGSPAIAAELLRRDDRLRLVEMHQSEVHNLKKRFGRDRRVNVIDGDGFLEIKGLLPPQSRRGLVLIDPSYEIKSDYGKVIRAVNEGLKRFATGTFLVWYPLINSVDAQRYAEQLQKIPCDAWLDVQLRVSRPPQGHGMYGSGMFVINPPWLLAEQLGEGMPELTRLLAQDDSADWSLTQSPQ